LALYKSNKYVVELIDRFARAHPEQVIFFD
jgi:hypothetical protein